MNQARKLLTELVEPFRSGDGFDIGLILAFVVINVLVFVNAVLHDPRIGYDAGANLEYIEALSHLRLVTPADSYEYFSAPLPYALPALLMAVTGMNSFWAVKLAQYANVFLSLGSTYYLIKTCQLISSRPTLKLGALVFLGILPLYYKSFAFVRGEPFIVFFSMVILYYSLLTLLKRRFTAVNAIILGTAIGLCALSRQWGILLFPAFLLLFAFEWVRLPEWRGAIAKTLCVSLVLAALIGGWFYLSLQLRYGSTAAFNKPPEQRFSLANQPLEFYVGLSPRELFSEPVRPNFANQLIPMFYSDVWGDYWCYFTIYAKDIGTGEFIDGYHLNEMLLEGSIPSWVETNYGTASAYLGRVNLVSIFPSVVALVALFFAAAKLVQRHGNDSLIVHPRAIYGVALAAIGATMVGYLWFLIMYPSIGRGDTIKATYVLQVFPFIAILVGIFLAHVQERSQLLYRLILVGLCLSFVHNLPAMLTHYRL
jgi:hypothetical protein